MDRMICLLALLWYAIVFTSCSAQPVTHSSNTSQDTLRGTITPERVWWDVISYRIHVEPDYNKKFIEGTNEIHFKALSNGRVMQIDLQQPMTITQAQIRNKKISLSRNGNVYYLTFPQQLKAGSLQTIKISYRGNPVVAKNAPWDGGWIFAKDQSGRPWMTVACQGLGASVWYPCKDHQSDEPDSAFVSITVPDSLVAVANGRLLRKDSGRNKSTYHWGVSNPINSYNIIPYIGKYVNWKTTFPGEAGTLDCSYWVIDYNLEKAKEQFSQVPGMLSCFEHWFGPYPFYEDGFKLVESPHLGMEHQSAIAYGNKFRNGYLGKDLSGTGWGNKWDFIIVHESGHEWFANNITTNDIADMWVHEGFTHYSEALYTQCQFGKEAGSDYVIGTRKLIKNDIPVIGPYGVNREGSGDMYYKGASVVHMVRQIINNDEKFREILRGLNKTFYHQTVTSKQVEDYIISQSGIDFTKLFDQYLRTTQIPVLEYRIRNNSFDFRWTNCIDGFNMPVRLNVGNNFMFIYPTQEWKTMTPTITDSAMTGDWIKNAVDRNFYIQTKKVDPSL